MLDLASSNNLRVRIEALIVISYIVNEYESVDLLKLCMDYESFVRNLVTGLKITSS